MPGNSDPYTYPGTDVLRNLHGIPYPQRLADCEADATVTRLAELDAAPLKGQFDIPHLKAIHHYIFQDVYRWAGDFRTVNMSKGGTLFAVAAFIEPALAAIFEELRAERHLRGTGIERFTQRAGFYLGEINAVHPFREGNGRVQREYIRELGAEAGFAIDWSRTGREEMMAASRESFETGDSSRLAAVIRGSIL